jgi:glutathionylspermidine synthase
VKKPIVGHGGQNITLYGPGGDSVLAATTGHFSDRDSIYQDLISLKNTDGYYSIINSWIIRGYYAGFSVREDQNLIINNQSPMRPCCIVWEEEK